MVPAQYSENDWLARIGRNGRFFVIPELKLIYVSIPKNACTTLKWLMATLAGEKTDLFTSGLRPHTSPYHVVHRRSQFQKVRFPDDLAEAFRAEVHPSNNWFIFTAIRDPWTRFFSAWQDKILCRSPIFRQYRSAPWYPPIEFGSEQIVESFATFTEFAMQPDFPPLMDEHFIPQSDLLQLEVVPYSKVYTLDSLADLTADLSRHLQSLGRDEPVKLKHSNETSLRANVRAYPISVRTQVAQIYTTDLCLAGRKWSFEESVTGPDWTASDIREARVRAETAHRLGDVRRIAFKLQEQAAEAAARASADARRADTTIAELKANVEQLEASLVTASNRAESAARKASRIVKAQRARPAPIMLARRLLSGVASRINHVKARSRGD